MCFLKYDYKLKIENMVVPVGTTGVNGLRWSMRGSARPRWTISFQRCPQSCHPCPPRHLQASQGGSIPKFIWNSHFIKNIPKPSLYQILGCSTDAEFYARVDHRPWIQNFYKEFPYGSEYGYTNLSIVAVPDHPIHGFVWSDWRRVEDPSQYPIINFAKFQGQNRKSRRMRRRREVTQQ